MIEINTIWTVLTGLLIIWNAHTAGKLKVAMDIDAMEGNKTNWTLFAWWVINMAFAVYFVISLYGYGVERGGM